MQQSDKPGERIRLVRGDITKIACDAIVNAANSSLLGGGGVDGAIHRVAGPGLLQECKTLKGCPTGEAKITSGYNLPSKYVIHTVGPIWKGGHKNEHKLLADSYRNSLSLARDNKVTSLAFSAISTGVYHFPPEQAANIAIKEVRRFIDKNIEPHEVIFVLFTDELYNLYLNLL